MFYFFCHQDYVKILVVIYQDKTKALIVSVYAEYGNFISLYKCVALRIDGLLRNSQQITSQVILRFTSERIQTDIV